MTATFRRFTARSDEQRPDIKVSVNLPGMAVSVINETPEEIVLLSVHVLSIALEQAAVQQTAFVKVDHAQLDNMTSQRAVPGCGVAVFRARRREAASAAAERHQAARSEGPARQDRLQPAVVPLLQRAAAERGRAGWRRSSSTPCSAT